MGKSACSATCTKPYWPADLFKVAKNKARPFIVRAGDTRVRAVGTRFSVRVLQGKPVQVLVQEGVVEVIRGNQPSAKPIRAVADTKAVVWAKSPIVVEAMPPQEMVRDVAWQYGKLAFGNRSLAEAAEEFERYSATKIVIDPAVRHRTITGIYASDDPAGFARDAATVLNLHVAYGPREVRIIP